MLSTELDIHGAGFTTNMSLLTELVAIVGRVTPVFVVAEVLADGHLGR